MTSSLRPMSTALLLSIAEMAYTVAFILEYFFYSADYFEKVLIATIRGKGQCPCPRRKVTKGEVSNVGKTLGYEHQEIQNTEG